jgi:hypothetical protein
VAGVPPALLQSSRHGCLYRPYPFHPGNPFFSIQCLIALAIQHGEADFPRFIAPVSLQYISKGEVP